MSGRGNPIVAASYNFAEEISKQSNGRLKIEVFEGGTLGYSGFELPLLTARGMIEMSEAKGNNIASNFNEPAFEVAILPFIFSHFSPEFDKIEPRLATEEAWPIFERLAGKHNLVIRNFYHCPDSLYGNKRVTTVEDWQGLKLRSWSEFISKLGQALDATTFTIPFSDLYTSFATNVIEANPGQALDVKYYKIYEVIDYYLLWNVDAAWGVTTINKLAFEALDKDLQDLVFKLHNDLMVPEGYDKSWSSEWEDQKKIEELGVEIVEIAPEEIAKARAIVKEKLWEPWLETAGPDGQELFDIFSKY